MLEVKPLLPALVFILSTQWLIVLLELCCLEEEEEGFDLPTLRVQAPLYRRGPSYSLSFGFRLPCGYGLGVGPILLCPLPGRKPLYKAPFPLDRHNRGICPRFASDPFVEEGLARCGWWRPCVAGVTLVSGLCRSCWDPATFNKASIRGFHRLHRLGPPMVKMSAGC
jgi:hypothetical protein